MPVAAKLLSARYRDLSCPVTIMAGDADHIVNYEGHAQRLHGEIAGSQLHIMRSAGHMIHHVDPNRIVEAIDGVAVQERGNVRWTHHEAQA